MTSESFIIKSFKEDIVMNQKDFHNSRIESKEC